jgi:predicted transcriptional regulator
MLCFFGPDLERNKAALQRLTERDLLVKEQFKGAYSLTRNGFEAMKTCEK